MLRKDFDEFLFANVGKDSDGTPVTMLTVLARLGVDPWQEAADLAHLSREPAMQRLASRLEAMPGAPGTAEETVNIVTRLIALLHRVPTRNVPLPETPLAQKVVAPSKRVSPAIYFLIGLIFLLLAQSAISDREPKPMDTSIAPAITETARR